MPKFGFVSRQWHNSEISSVRGRNYVRDSSYRRANRAQHHQFSQKSKKLNCPDSLAKLIKTSKTPALVADRTLVKKH